MVVGEIDTNDISVVVQGGVDKTNTPKCLVSVRKYFPGAEIILSTWEGTNVTNLSYDKVLFNKDPGGWKDGKTGIPNNLNRQIVSTIEGIRSSTRKYCIKIRSDICFRANSFLKYFFRFPKRENTVCLFKNRILTSSYFFKRYLGEAQYSVQPTPFHLSDWFLFGLTEDLALLFNIPLSVEPENSNYLFTHKFYSARCNIFGASHRYAPEQYILLSCIRKNMTQVPEMKSIVDYTAENILFSERFVASNFIVLNPSQISLYCLKNGIDPYCKWSKNELALPIYVWEGLYRFDVFVYEYKKYCDPAFKIPQEATTRKQKYLLFHKFFEVRG